MAHHPNISARALVAQLLATTSRLEETRLVAAAMAPPIPNLVRKEGEYWTIAYEGTLLRLRDGKGLDYLACLLGHPRQEFHVADLVQIGRRGHEAGDLPGAMPNAERNHQRAVAPDNEVEIRALEADRGSYLGYVRLIGRRNAQTPLADHIVSIPTQTYAKKPLLRGDDY